MKLTDKTKIRLWELATCIFLALFIGYAFLIPKEVRYVDKPVKVAITMIDTGNLVSCEERRIVAESSLHECSSSNSQLIKKQCGDFDCKNPIWFYNYETQKVDVGYITLYTNEVYQQGVMGTYWINTEKTMVDNEYIGPEFILSPKQIFRTKKELLDSIQ